MPESLTGDEASGTNAGQNNTTATENSVNTGASSEAQSQDTTNSSGAPADSPPVKDDKQPKDMLSAVRAALDKGKEQSSGSGDGEGQETDPSDPPATGGEQPPAGGEEDDSELTDEEFKLLKPKTQRRIRQLLGQVEQYRPEAEQYQGIRQFCVDANLTKEDVNTGFNIMSLMRNKPAEALEALEPIMTTLRALVGETLPKDLQEQVTSGKITEQHAKELSRLRAAKNLDTARQQVEEEEGKTRDAQAQRKALGDDVGKAVSEWETRWKTSDPDYRVKHTRVMREIKLALLEARDAGKMPKNRQEAVDLAERVKKEVEADMKKSMPRKAAVTPVTQVNSQPGSKPAPRNTLEAIKQAIGQ